VKSLSDQIDVVIGVDTHKHTHTAAIVLAGSGARQATLTVAADPSGFEQLAAAAGQHGTRKCWAIEGCGSWGRGLVQWLQERGEQVIEVDRPKRPARRMGQKDDGIDALRAARETLATTRHATPRASGQRDAVAAVQAARRSAIGSATDAERQLLGLATTAPEQLAHKLRGRTTANIVKTCARWRPDTIADEWTRSIASTMRRIAQRIIALRDEAAKLEQTLTNLVKDWRPDLLARRGVGPVVAGIVLGAWSHPGRIHSEVAFAMIAGCAPIPASSGQTVRHRLNRHGDRQLNWAIHVIYLQRARHDQTTHAYIDRRRAEGKTDREIRRCVKRYIARELFNLLEHPLDNQ
jgi:transposase